MFLLIYHHLKLLIGVLVLPYNEPLIAIEEVGSHPLCCTIHVLTAAHICLVFLLLVLP